MSYHGVEYTQGYGPLEVQRVPSVNTVVSWIILTSLQMALLVVIAGLGLSLLKYAMPSVDLTWAPAAIDKFARVALHAYASR